jgi:hypothetical protein
MIIANIDPVTAFNFQFIAIIIVLICTLFNLYWFFHGHRHDAKDIDITVTNPQRWNSDFKESRSLDKLWIRLLEHLKLKLTINTEPREDILVEGTTKPTPPKSE